jgi:hypothetical protein
LELRDLLAPKVSLKKPFRLFDDAIEVEGSERLERLVEWELVLEADHAQSLLQDLADDQLKSALPLLLGDLEQLLRDALDLQRELGDAGDFEDRSHWDLPELKPQSRHRSFQDWVVLIELLRDSWTAILADDPARAARIAHGWFDVPYPTFKRLALFAASHDGNVDPDEWLSWLLEDNAWWLWSDCTQRETLDLLSAQGLRLSAPAQRRLEAAVLMGPPRDMYRNDLEDESWAHEIDRAVSSRLANLAASGVVLGAAATERLDEISGRYPGFQLARAVQDGSADGPDNALLPETNTAPRRRRELVQWLQRPPSSQGIFYEDTWRDTCRTRLFHSVYALCDLSRENIWPAYRWREALQTWAEEGLALRSWKYAGPLVAQLPDNVLMEVANAVTWWLEVVSKSIDRHESIMLELCDRVLRLTLKAESGMTRNGKPIDQPVTEAINHPVGRVTQALTNLWFKRQPGDNDQLPADIESFFTRLCDTTIDRFRHGRVLLGANLIALFRVDRAWTERMLLPLFDWTKDSREARGAWEGFLWSPRLHRPLLIAFKAQFLGTALHYADLGDHAEQFASFITYAALEPLDGYTTEDFRSAIGALPPEGLRQSAQALHQAMEGAGEQREEYWKNRVRPFWQDVWPKSRDLATPDIAQSLVRLIIGAGLELPAALTTLEDWLCPIQHPNYVVQLLRKSSLDARFPNDAIRLLDKIIANQPWVPPELKQSLDVIVEAEPRLARDPRFIRLRERANR